MTTHKAIVRIRPKLPRETAASITVSTNEVRVSDATHYITTACPTLLTATSSQDDVYQQVAPSISRVAKGFNAAVIAYGDTGSGKTFTMYGSAKERPGIIDRAVKQLFESLSPNLGRGKKYSVVLSNVLIHNERVFDLLDLLPLHSELQVRTSHDGGILIENLSECVVDSAEACLNLIERGQDGRSILEERVSADRSHVILHLKIESRKVCKHGKLRRMKLTFCDMASSEKDMRGEESISTVSLRSFRTVVSLLASGNPTYVPYRESKLTTLLQHALHPSSYTCYIHTISPAHKSIDATIDSLGFLTKTSSVPLSPDKRVFLANQTLSQDLREEVAELRDALERYMPNHSPAQLKQVSEQDSVVAEIEELLNTKYNIEQEIGSARQSPAKQESDKDRFFPARPNKPPTSDFPAFEITPETGEEPSKLEKMEKDGEFEVGKRLEVHTSQMPQTLPSSPLPAQGRNSTRSHRVSASDPASLDLSLDRIVVSSARSKEERRQKVLDSARQASSALRNRSKPSTSNSRPDIFLSPEEAAAIQARVDAELHKLEESKEAQQRRLEQKMQRELQEQEEFRRKLNRKPAIEPRGQRPIRAGMRNLLLE